MFQDVAFDYNSTYGATSAELGSFDYADLTPAFLKAIECVDAGAVTEPVEVSGAIHLLKIDERVPGRLRQFDAVKNDIYQTILDQKTDAKIKEWTQALKSRAFIDIRL
jgi:peptidyl-prolyl cis-trans isomerase SurA